MPFKYLKLEQNETFDIYFRREFSKFAEVRGDRHGRGPLRTSEFGTPWSSIKILNLVALIQEIRSFGYTSNDDVKERYHSCMMKGKYEKICDLICKKVSALSASDPGDDSANKCYQCRGKQRYTHRQRPTWHMADPKIYFRWTGEAWRVLFTKIIFKWILLELKKLNKMVVLLWSF